ncbi:MAG: GntR family transcriptional regulator [Candidatus Aminicenantes bacterium]|nr:GntR family transcriptional regulator [Candidatus Aminicenantes bacterium]
MSKNDMFIVISTSNPDPMYKQVTDQIKDAIAAGSLAPGSKIPSIREMARELNISEITIKRAYSDLENEGFILTRSGMGSFVADVDRQKLRSEKLEEIKKDLEGMLKAGEKFGITTEDVIRILKVRRSKK